MCEISQLFVKDTRKNKDLFYYYISNAPPAQGSTISLKSPYVITYVCQNFGVHDVRGQIPKHMYQAYLLPSDFPNNFS